MRTGKRGFTLLEMLIALGVFAVIGLMASQILSGIVDLSGTVRERSDQLTELQRAMFILSRDIDQIVRRPARDTSGHATSALAIGEPLIEFTRHGWQNPLRSPRSELQRVAYTMEAGDLVRTFWPVLDRGPDTEPIVQVLLGGVEEVEFVAHGADGAEFRYWPRELGPDAGQTALAAIELRLDHATYGRLARLWPVASAAGFLRDRDDGPDLPEDEDEDADVQDDFDIEKQPVL